MYISKLEIWHWKKEQLQQNFIQKLALDGIKKETGQKKQD